MKNEKPSGLNILWIVIFVVAALFAMRFIMALGRVFLVVGALGLLAYGIYELVSYLRQSAEKKRYAKSTEGIIENRVDRCMAEIGKNRKAIAGIRQNIEDLEKKLLQASQATAESRGHTRKLIGDFQAEIELREAKIRFLETCVQKLQVVLHNYELSKAFAQKKSELQMLREKNFDEIADLEALRSDIEYDRAHLETIDYLSTRLLGSQSLETVDALRRELEEMTRSLDDKE
jgi:hypothetical protein